MLVDGNLLINLKLIEDPAKNLVLGREQIAAALQLRVVLAVVIFAVVVPIPMLAVLKVKIFHPPPARCGRRPQSPLRCAIPDSRC